MSSAQDYGLSSRFQPCRELGLYGAEGDKRPRAQPLKRGSKPKPRPDKVDKPPPSVTLRDPRQDPARS